MEHANKNIFINYHELNIQKAIRNNKGFKSWGLHSVASTWGSESQICHILQFYTIHNLGLEEIENLWREMTDVSSLGQ